MRLWSINPCYLDSKGLVALWRESLLAQKVLMGKTKGYTKHPQLERFKKCKNPVAAINTYLHYVYTEAVKRNYNFDETKIEDIDTSICISVTEGQLMYEFSHLLKKLRKRDIETYEKWKDIKKPVPHNLFFSTPKYEKEYWEVLKT